MKAFGCGVNFGKAALHVNASALAQLFGFCKK